MLIKNIIILLVFINIKFVYSDAINVAVSSNFLSTFKIIGLCFEKKYNCDINICADSTAHLYNKIINNAPFNLFISADKKHPLLLESRYNKKADIYAYGSVVLWTNNFVIKKNIIRRFNDVNKFAVANVLYSPYGKYSKMIFKNLNLTKKNIITGTNINQTYSFIALYNDCIGFVALSQVIHNKINENFFLNIPIYLVSKIEQRMIIINNDSDNLTLLLYNYIKSNECINIIKQFGYKI